MRKSPWVAVVAVVVILVAGLAAGLAWWTWGRDAGAPASTIPSSSAAPSAAPSRPADAFAMTVASVWDGDTLRATLEEPNDLIATTDEVRIRLIGIDTPELGEQCWADEARDALRELLPDGSTVWVQPGEDPLDRYDRWLFYLWTDDGRFVNYELVAAGDAETLPIPPNDEHAELFARAEASAVQSQAGQWGACTP